MRHPDSYNGRWENFSDNELRCQHTGLLNPSDEFITLMDKVQLLREILDRPLTVTSAYRHPTHPIEAAKEKGGQHTKAAIDLAVSGHIAYKVLELAFSMGFTGIGVQQKGDGRFIHLDIRSIPTVWSY